MPRRNYRAKSREARLEAEERDKTRLTYMAPGDTLTALYRLLTEIDREDMEDELDQDVYERQERRALAEAINRVKLNVLLLAYLKEHDLINPFKDWLESNRG